MRPIAARPDPDKRSVEALWEHVDAGEDPAETAQQFGLTLADLQRALPYETARRAA